jgi:hypothetical protein
MGQTAGFAAGSWIVRQAARKSLSGNTLKESTVTERVTVSYSLRVSV